MLPWLGRCSGFKSPPVHSFFKLFKMIKAIIFDIGGVLIDIDGWINSLMRHSTFKNKRRFSEMLNRAALPICKNEINEAEFLTVFCAKMRIKDKKIAAAIFINGFKNYIKINNDVVNIAKKLKKHFKLGIISNIIPQHAAALRNKSFLKLFDEIILSCDIKKTKEEPEIFIRIAKKLNIFPNECLFVDDIKYFADVAKSVGMKAIVFKNNRQFSTEIKKYANIQQ